MESKFCDMKRLEHIVHAVNPHDRSLSERSETKRRKPLIGLAHLGDVCAGGDKRRSGIYRCRTFEADPRRIR